MTKSEKLLQKIADKLIDKKVKRFKKDIFFTGHMANIIFNDEKCFIRIYPLSSGVKGNEIKCDDEIVRILKEHNVVILKNFKYFEKENK